MKQSATEPSMAAAWGTVIVLFLLSSMAWMDRSVISMVIGPIRRHFAIGDFQVSLLLGFAFVFFYILLLIPIGWLADRVSRRAILYGGILVWSLAASFCGLASSYPQLFAARMMVGAGEGCVSPAAAGIISRLFGRARMAAPMSLYSLGSSAGTAIGAIAAGHILQWGARHGDAFAVPLAGRLETWQMVFLILGLPGVVVGLLAFAILDPPPPSALAAGSGHGALAYLRAHGHAFGYTVGGFVCVNVAVTAVISWTPEYLHRRWAVAPAQAGWAIGTISLTAPLLLQAGAGFVVNRMIGRGVGDAPARLMRWLLIAALPLGAGLWLAPTPVLYLACMFLLMAVIFPSNPLGITTVQLIAPARLRSQLAAMHLALLGVVGIGFGSSIVGFLSQYCVGETNLNEAMGLVVLASSCLAALLLTAGLRPMRATVAALQAAEAGRARDRAPAETACAALPQAR